MRAEIEINCKKPQIVVKSLEPEIEDTKKFKVDISSSKEAVKIRVESDDISGLLAGINSYITLIRTSINSMEE
jgi:tRNA threonylcarbamoyladenosine modification (KEOPS) complex  Pcc1 subunit